MPPLSPDEQFEEAHSEVLDIIRKSHTYITDSQIQQDALQKSMDFIVNYKRDEHIFCNTKLYPAAIHLMILFSFDDSEPLRWYKRVVGESLNYCTNCMSLFQRGRAKIKETFIVDRGVDYKNVVQFSNNILSWEAERLQERFIEYVTKYNDEESNQKAEVPQELIYCIAECLYAPGILRVNTYIKEVFERTFYALLLMDHPFIRKTSVFLPGFIYLLFEGSDPLRRCAFNLLDGLASDNIIFTESSVFPEILEEFEEHFITIQDHTNFSAQKCELYYRNILAILRLFNSDAIINKFNQPADMSIVEKEKDYEIKPLLKLLQHHIMAYLNEPFPYILRFFSFILENLGDKYWNLIAPYTFQNSLETIIESPYYLKNLVILKQTTEVQHELDPPARLGDLFSWIQHFLTSIDSSKGQQASNRLSLYFITQVESQNGIPLDNKAELFKVACRLVSKALTFPKALYSPSFRTDILSRSDARVVVTSKLIRFMDYATSAAIFYPEHERAKNGEVAKAAVGVIADAFRFDVLNFAQGSYDALNGAATSTLKFSPSLFRLILKQNFAVQRELAFKLLCSLANVSSVIPLESQHKADVSEFLGYLRQFFIKFSDIDAKNIKLILSDPRSLKGYWSCVFSSDENIYQSSIDILYETFDSEGRLEGVHSLLENNISACLSAINENLTNLIFLKSYYPCPRGVLVLSDIVQALNSPVNGLFGYSSKFSSGVKAALATFWNRGWSFLDLIYTETIKWATKHENLIEFTRDTLDLSHLLLDCFKNIKDLQGDNKKPFSEITNTFPHMLSWLRLNDPGLLASCVKLISKTIDLAMDLDIEFDKKAIELIARYGSRAKKFNSRLTPQQSLEIMNRAKFFDKDLVESIILESENYRKSRQPSPAPPPTASTSLANLKTLSKSPTPVDDDDVKIISQKRVRQTTLLDKRFGSLTKVAPTAPPPKPTEKSARDLALEAIKAKRARVVHPAGQPGFNSRKRTPRPGDSSSSDDDDVDKDNVHSLFNLPQPNRVNTGIQVIEFNNSKKKTIDNQRREEEYSRLRLNVDLKPLYRKLLRWSYKKTTEYPDDDHIEPKNVADKFKSAEDYISTYEPLLLLECWQAILSAKARSSDTPLRINVGSKSTVGDFFEVFVSITKTQLANKNFSDSDLVVLAVSNVEDKEPTVDDVKNAPITCFGKIHEIKHVRGDRADLTIRITRAANLNNAITPMSVILMMRVMQMTTIEREFSSLYGLRYYNLAKNILEADPNEVSEIPPAEVANIQTTYKVNESQAKAIGSCVDTVGFNLIQGPPGTGKTKTILGIIGYMLSHFKAKNAIAVPGQNVSNTQKARKVLVCAPSNAAVDELVLRLKDGIMNAKGEKYTPKLVRLGRTDAVNTAVKDVTLEELVDREVGKSSTPENNMDSLHKQLAEIKSKISICQAKLSDEKNTDTHIARQEKRELTIKANGVKKMMDDERERQNSAYRVREINRRNIQARILGESEIICSTLSGSAHDMVANIGIKFDSVIIDEACQCTELSAIIPLRYGCNRCIMVGDPNQLPPTVLSSVASDHLYDQSLFVRMAKNRKPLLLNIQYRMNSMISKFPSKMFYDNRLKDGPDNDKLTVRPWHQDPLLSPYRFFDIVEGKQIQDAKTFSYTNHVEIKIAMELVSKLFKEFPNIDFRNKIGLITPYKEQNRALQKAFIQNFGKNIKAEISFNTIDGFQGQEKEIIIMSCVRADSKSNSVGFLKDFRRMNVALTRPKCSLWILGNHDSLVKDSLWSELISDAKSRNLLSETKIGFSRKHNNSSNNNTKKFTSNHPAQRSSHNAPSSSSASPASTAPAPAPAEQYPRQPKKSSFAESIKPNSDAKEYTAKKPEHKKRVTFAEKEPDVSNRSPNNIFPTNVANNNNQRAHNTQPISTDQISSRSGVLPNINNNVTKSSNSGTLPPTIPTGPLASRSGTLPPMASGSGTLPPLPTGPRGHVQNHKKRRQQTPQSIFINKKRRPRN